MNPVMNIADVKTLVRGCYVAGARPRVHGNGFVQLDLTSANDRRAAVVVKQIIVHQMMTIEEVCTWLNKEEGAIRQQVARARSGKSPNPIPFYQPGGKGCDLRFDYSEIVKWARGGKEE